MLLRVLDRSHATRIYHEDDDAAFDDFLLRSDDVVRSLVRRSPAPSQIFKPICDSQQAASILERFADARGVWIFRAPDAVARSAVTKWGSHQREVVDAVAAGDLAVWGWRTADLSDEAIAAVRSVHRSDLSDHEGALLFWYLRNQFFFSQGLDAHERVRLVCYEDLTQDPAGCARGVFEHVGAPFSTGFVDDIHASSVGGEVASSSPEIQALCQDLYDRLRAATDPAPAVVGPVLMLINTLGTGGAERYAVTVSNWLVRQGAEVTLASSGGEMDEGLVPEVRQVHADLREVRGDFPLIARQVRKIIREVRPAVIMCHSLILSWLARAAQVRRHIPIVTVAHGWPEDKYAQVGRMIGVADRVVAVSPDVKAKLVAGGLDPARCEVVFNGVDCTPLGRRTGELRTARRAEMGAGPDEVLVINLGRLADQKAQHHIVEVARALRAEHPELRYALIGEGEREDELRALIAEAGVGDILTLMGLRMDAADLLGSGDIYLSSSNWEGMPLSTIEAMAAELPIVATRTEGADQLLTPECSVVCPVGDAQAMGAAVRELTQDVARRTELARAARARALAEFSSERMSRQLADVMERVALGD